MLDHKEVVVEGDKDGRSSTGFLKEGSSLLSMLGGSREAVREHTKNRALPISTIASFLSKKLGQPVPVSGVRGGLAQVFGGDAGKLAMSFALNKMTGGKSRGSPLSMLLGGSSGSGGSNPLMSMLGSSMGQGASHTHEKKSGLSSMVGGLLGKKTETHSSGGGAGALLGAMLGGGKTSNSTHTSSHTSSGAGSDPLGMVCNMLGDLGLGGAQSVTSAGAPPYKPTHNPLSPDVGVLITGCQAHETSADVRPPGTKPFGALSNAIKTVYSANPNVTHYELVQGVRSHLSSGGFKQNPCLECSRRNADTVFIC